MQFKLTFNCDNSAFRDSVTGNVMHDSPDTQVEVARILREVANRIESGDYFDMYRNIKDINGNIVGTYAMKDE